MTEALREFTFYAAGDNHEPTRDFIVGAAGVYSVAGTDQETLVLARGLELFKDGTKAVFLVDDGDSVEPWYVTGWQPTEGSEFEGCIFLQRFPLSRGTRPDNGHPIDMSRWMLGPRTTYHLKVDKGFLSPPCQNHSMAGVRRG